MTEESLPERINRAINRAVQAASERYGDNTALRVVVTSVPYIGGGLDLVFASEGQRAIKERIHRLLGDMKERMEQVEEEAINKEYLESEEFIDLVFAAFDAASKTRDDQKIRLYARVLTEATITAKQGKYFPEEYLNLLGNLTPMEVEVARVIYDVQGEPIEGYNDEALEVWRVQRDEMCERLGLDHSELIFMLRSLAARGLVSEIGITTPGQIAVTYSISRSFVQMMEFLQSDG